MSRELRICTTRMISLADSLKAVHSAPAVQRATMLACLECHMMGMPLKKR